MGTNYYYEPTAVKPCSECGRGFETERLHIGKSSAGWVFSLCIYPDRNINTLEDWKRVWASGGQIRDEYGEFVPIPDMVACITLRSHPTGLRFYCDGTTHFIKPGEPTWRTTTETDFS